jgi:hypothetical protein
MLIQGGAGVSPRSIPFYIRMGGIIPHILHVFSGEERNMSSHLPPCTVHKGVLPHMSPLIHMRGRKIRQILTLYIREEGIRASRSPLVNRGGRNKSSQSPLVRAQGRRYYCTPHIGKGE